MACDKEQELYDSAVEASDAAEIAHQSAVDNKDAAAWSLGAAMLSTVACAAAIPVGLAIGSLPGAVVAFILCEAIAIMLIEAALKWLESAVAALVLTSKALQAAHEAEDKAGHALECCLNNIKTPPGGGIDVNILQKIFEMIQEAETAVDASVADGDEIDGLIDDAADAVEDLEEAVEEDLEEQKDTGDDSGYIF